MAAEVRVPTSGGQGYRAPAQRCEVHEQVCCDRCPRGGCRMCLCRRHDIEQAACAHEPYEEVA
jgi:hypothetical protein